MKVPIPQVAVVARYLGETLAARLCGEIMNLGKEIDRLEFHGLRASPQLVQRVLGETGERRDGIKILLHQRTEHHPGES